MSKKVFPKQRGVVVAKARNGYGVFATRRFEKGETIFEITGPYVTCDEDEDLEDAVRANTYRFDENYYINPVGTVADRTNHSCNPNAKIVKKDNKLFVVAHKHIVPKKEICFDYSTILASDDVWTMKCNCGSRLCRDVVRRFRLLPKELRARYIREAIVPAYIRAL